MGAAQEGSSGKLASPVRDEAAGQEGEPERTFSIAVAGSPKCVVIKVEKRTCRSLVDTGAEVSLISGKAFQNLKDKPKVEKDNVSLQSVNGDSLRISGRISLPFKIGQQKFQHNFYIIDDLNRNFILSSGV